MSYFNDCFGEYRTAELVYEFPTTELVAWFLEIVGWENVAEYRRGDKTIITLTPEPKNRSPLRWSLLNKQAIKPA